MSGSCPICHFRQVETRISTKNHGRIRQDSTNSTCSIVAVHNTKDSYLEAHLNVFQVSNSRVSVDCQDEYFFQCLKVINYYEMGVRYPYIGIYIPLNWRHDIINCAGTIYILPFAYKLKLKPMHCTN